MKSFYQFYKEVQGAYGLAAQNQPLPPGQTTPTSKTIKQYTGTDIAMHTAQQNLDKLKKQAEDQAAAATKQEDIALRNQITALSKSLEDSQNKIKTLAASAGVAGSTKPGTAQTASYSSQPAPR